MTMTILYFVVTFLVVIAIFAVVNRGRGMLFALGASLFTLVALGAAYLGLAAIIVRTM